MTTTPTTPATPTLADLIATEKQADAIRASINERLAAANQKAVQA